MEVTVSGNQGVVAKMAITGVMISIIVVIPVEWVAVRVIEDLV